MVKVRVNLQQMIGAFGLRRTIWLLDFQAAWTIAVKDNAWQPIDAEQYAAYWRKSRAQGYRDQAKWRAAYPEELTPNDRALTFKTEWDRSTAEKAHEPSRQDITAAFVAALA
jgi:hypothetical protein